MSNSLDSMNCSSTPGFPVLHHLLEFVQTHIHGVSDAMQPSRPLLSLLLLPSIFPASESFPMWRLFASGGQSIGASASASVLPMNIQGWFTLGLTGVISVQSKRLSRVFSNTTVWRPQFFGARPFLLSSFHICIWLLGKPKFWLNGLL